MANNAEFKFEPVGNLGEFISAQKMTNTSNDQSYLRISKLYKDKTTGEMKPSSQGISIPYEFVPDLAALLNDLLNEQN